jgi:hypothetical protein
MTTITKRRKKKREAIKEYRKEIDASNALGACFLKKTDDSSF